MQTLGSGKVLETNSLISDMSRLKIGFNRLVHKRQKYRCKCGCTLRRDGKAAHLKSEKHKFRIAGKKFDKKKWAKEECVCPVCGTKSTKGNLAAHKKSAKCLKAKAKK